MSMKPLSILLLLSAFWGGSFLFIRIAAPVLGPYLLVESRLVLGLVGLLIYALIIRQKLAIRSHWKQFLIAGLINVTIPFLLIAYAEITLPASLAAILNATTPLFTAIVAWIWLKEALTPWKVMGLVLGFVGVVVLVGWTPVELNSVFLIAVFCSLLGAIFYGMGVVYIKRAVQASSLELSVGQLLGAAVCLAPFSFLQAPSTFPSTTVILSVLALALLCTSIGYLLYFYLLRVVGPTQVVYVTFLAPVFGVAWGVIFLQEVIGVGTVVGFSLIFTSIFFLTFQRKQTVS